MTYYEFATYHYHISLFLYNFDNYLKNKYLFLSSQLIHNLTLNKILHSSFKNRLIQKIRFFSLNK